MKIKRQSSHRWRSSLCQGPAARLWIQEFESSVRIAILGASGAVGSTLAVHILRSGLLEPQDCLMLVGHGTHSIERRLMPVRVDLLDAFDDERVQISIVPDIDEFEADIVVVAAGETKSSEHECMAK